MKAIASVAFGLASAVGVCIVGALLASHAAIAEPEHALVRVGLQPDLWTHEPTSIIQSQQRYERLPAMLSSYAEQERQTAASKPNVRVFQPQAPTVQATPAVANQSAAHRNWCGAKFRSYDSATDTYRSFAGDRRACVSPNAEAPSPIAITISFDQDHARWCAAKYASYRNSDNSYQPFAGPRITCEAPGDSNRQVATAR
jgi:hypothetical protein